jgi:hypothetical protein
MECRQARDEFINAAMRGTIQETNDFLGHRTVIKCRCDPLSLAHEQFPLPDRPAAAANNVVCLRHRCVLIFILRCSNQGNSASSSHASCHRNDGVPFSLALSPPPISVRQGERRYPGRWAEIAPLFAACETGASKPLTVVLMSPLIGRHKMRASWKGHVNLPITIRGPPCGPLKIPEVSVCCTPLQRLQRQLA